MLENSWTTDDLKTMSIQQLIQFIIAEGSVDALTELSHRVSIELQKQCDIQVGSLDFLSLYYLYFIWMNDESRENFVEFFMLINKDLESIWKSILNNPEYLYSDNYDEFDDILHTTILEIAEDIVYRFFNGALGKKREMEPIFSTLLKLNLTNYGTITDPVYKILFLGNLLYGKDLFRSDAEYMEFKMFLMSKSYIVFLDQEKIDEGSKTATLEEELSVIRLI